jgi:hypothetical protein
VALLQPFRLILEAANVQSIAAELSQRWLGRGVGALHKHNVNVAGWPVKWPRLENKCSHVGCVFLTENVMESHELFSSKDCQKKKPHHGLSSPAGSLA